MSLCPSMFRAFIVILSAAVFLGGATGCSKEEAPLPGPVVKKIAPQPAAVPPQKAVEEEKKKPEAQAAAVYSPEGRRDPFVTFAKSEAEKLKDDRSALPPLQRYELGELKMVGVIWAASGAKALVEDAEGKGYTVAVGNRIGRSGGVVTRITDKEIVVKEEFPGAGGKTVSRESVLQLTTAGGNQ